MIVQPVKRADNIRYFLVGEQAEQICRVFEQIDKARRDGAFLISYRQAMLTLKRVGDPL
jgi:hypothetical protein